jgi:hypothetical protein
VKTPGILEFAELEVEVEDEELENVELEAPVPLVLVGETLDVEEEEEVLEEPVDVVTFEESATYAPTARITITMTTITRSTALAIAFLNDKICVPLEGKG